jgi:hypothetical protein
MRLVLGTFGGLVGPLLLGGLGLLGLLRRRVSH